MKEIVKHAWSQVSGFHTFIATSLVLLIIGEVLGIYTPYFFGTIINSMHAGSGKELQIAILAIGSLFASHIVGWIREKIDLKRYFFTFNEKIEAYASKKLMSLSVGQHLSMNSGTVLETISSGVGSLKDLVIIGLFNLVPHVFYVGISLVAIALVSWKMGILVIGLSALYIVVAIRFNKAYEVPLLSLETEHKKRSKFKSEMLRNAASVKLSGQEEWFMTRYNDEIIRVNSIAKTVWLKYNFGSNLIGLLRISVTAAALFYGLFLVRTGQETVGAFVMFFSWAGGVTARLNSIRSNLRELARMMPPIKKYMELVGQEPAIKETGTRTEIPYGAISFRNVTFRYEGGTKERGIAGVSFDIKPGEMIGIVGESGAGKSTIMRLLLRSWDPQSGGIYIDNIPLTDFASDFRQEIAFVQQEGQLFDNMVRFNLTIGMEERAADDFLLWQALESAQLKERIKKSELGLDSIVGERGIKLSGGERQRLLMARAIIRKSKIIILDEATSHLDVNTEEAIFEQAVKQASRGVTTLIVAHRFATLKSCDRIMVMDEGKLVAFDTHFELMNTCSIYRKLVEKQMLATVTN